jgi:hypothetical protein
MREGVMEKAPSFFYPGQPDSTLKGYLFIF